MIDERESPEFKTLYGSIIYALWKLPQGKLKVRAMEALMRATTLKELQKIKENIDINHPGEVTMSDGVVYIVDKNGTRTRK